MLPVLPDSTYRDHSPAVVQPHDACTLLISSMELPTLVKTYVYLTTAPPLIWPKSYSGVANCIFGPDTREAEATPANNSRQHK